MVYEENRISIVESNKMLNLHYQLLLDYTLSVALALFINSFERKIKGPVSLDTGETTING